MIREKIRKFLVGTAVFAAATACQAISAVPTEVPAPTITEVFTVTAGSAPTENEVPSSPTAASGTQEPDVPESCAIGLGLRQETAAILLAQRDHPGFVMSANMQLAVEYYPELSGWIRTLGAPSLAELETKASRAQDLGLEYEALSYGLETSVTTPEAEWRNLVAATQQARDLADVFGKQLVMGPGLRLMSENEGSYAEMASASSIWMIQTQRLQINPPGELYRQEVERIVSLLRSGNPEIEVWAQINFLPGEEPDPEEWLAYRESILDLVDGTFIGIYIWDSEDPEVLLGAITHIFETACK